MIVIVVVPNFSLNLSNCLSEFSAFSAFDRKISSSSCNSTSLCFVSIPNDDNNSDINTNDDNNDYDTFSQGIFICFYLLQRIF